MCSCSLRLSCRRLLQRIIDQDANFRQVVKATQNRNDLTPQAMNVEIDRLAREFKITSPAMSQAPASAAAAAAAVHRRRLMLRVLRPRPDDKR